MLKGRRPSGKEIHGTANLMHQNCLFFSYFHIYCFQFRITMKETFITDLLIVGAILVLLYGAYENNKFITFSCLNMEHFP